MCGIAGVYGVNALRLSLMITLAQINRGTRGTGLAWINHNRIKVLKEPIHPVKFFKKHYDRLEWKVKVAVAHNRQPSRGGVAYQNTHPFTDCKSRFALVHNGSCIFDNNIVSKIKKEHMVLGETDSEIITHLLEDLYEEHGDMVSAIEALFDTDFSGAILVLTRDGKIYGARDGVMPLHYCKTNTHVFLASEASAIEAILDTNAKIEALKMQQIIEVDGGRIEIHGEGIEEPPARYYYYPYAYASRRASSPYYPWYYDWED
jgi:glucosamine--fructose-6-phosphate aminotransferase (isomerizing)